VDTNWQPAGDLKKLGHVIAAVICFPPLGLISSYYYRKARRSGKKNILKF